MCKDYGVFLEGSGVRCAKDESTYRCIYFSLATPEVEFDSGMGIPYFSRITANSSTISRPKSEMRGSSLRHCELLNWRVAFIGEGIHDVVLYTGERMVARAQIRIIGCSALYCSLGTR